MRPSLTKQVRLILCICAVYIITWLGYYQNVTLGLVPAADEVAAITQALTSSPDESTTLYQILLGTLATVFGSSASLTMAVKIINGFALLTMAFLCAKTAGHFWKSNRAACAAALLIGFNPVLLFRVGQVTPTLLAAACVAVFAYLILPWLRHAKTKDSLIIGGALALGTLFETALIGPALIWPFAALLYPTRHKSMHLVLGVIGPAVAISLLMVSSLQLQQTLQLETSSLFMQLFHFFGNKEINDLTSYALHGRMHLLLLLNPIHWGALFILTIGGLYARKKDGHAGYSVYALLLVLALFSVGWALSSASGQSRLALVPFLSVFAAGCFATLPRIWHHASFPTKRKIIISTVLLAGFTYTSFALNTLSRSERDAGYSYMAKANIMLGKSEAAANWANKVLAIDSSRKDMRSILILADFNKWTVTSTPRPLSRETVRAHLAEIEQADTTNPIVASIEGIYLWKLGEYEAAYALWEANAERSALAQIGLLWTPSSTQFKTLPVTKQDPYTALLERATKADRKSIGDTKDEKLIDNLFSIAH